MSPYGARIPYVDFKYTQEPNSQEGLIMLLCIVAEK